MTRLRTLALGATLLTALAAAPFVVQAASPGAPTGVAFKAPLNAFGQPDLQGNWSNEDQAQTLLVLTPKGTVATERMRLLAVIGSARFAG